MTTALTTAISKTVEQSFDEIHEFIESIRNDGDHRLEVVDPGDCWYQGDVGLVQYPSLPDDALRIENPQLQLAPGNTQGSRHCLDSLEGITQYQLPEANALDGPLLHATREFTVTHPEHGNITKPAGVWGVFYQRARAEDLRKVQD